MPDKYDEAVAYLTKQPEKISDAWGDPDGHPGGALFGYVSKTGRRFGGADGGGGLCGCLTEVHAEMFVAETAELTNAIRSDNRLPDSEDEITVACLGVFAEWQRRIDKELGR